MRCKKHPSDLSTTVGVCASCLRERLFSLIAAQSQAQEQIQLSSCALSRAEDHAPPPLFPRSVSPHLYRGKSGDATWRNRSSGENQRHRHRHNLFFSTPQVGPTFSTTTNFVTTGSCSAKKKSRFSLWSGFFRSRSEQFESDPTSRDSCEHVSSATSSSSPSWFSSIFSGRRKKQLSSFSLQNSISKFDQTPCRRFDRGMSPSGAVNYNEYCDDQSDRCPSASGYSSESSQKWRQSPAVAPGSCRPGRSVHNRNISGLAFCLSPLVRATPNPHWNQKGIQTDMGFSGEIRAPVKPHLSTAASFCANRSRKLADFGRVNPKR